MSDVRAGTTIASATPNCGNPQGDFIWYELMTPDPEGAKMFYDAVVGWTVGEPIAGPVEYRMIGRSDGGNAGGMLRLTDDMARHGARPIWLGYIHVEDVDKAVSTTEAAGGKVYMTASDIPYVGRIAMVSDPQGASFYLMKPTPPAGNPDATSDVFSPDQPQRVSWNELNTSDPDAARSFYGEMFGWTSDDFMPMGELGEYRFWQHHGVPLGAVCGLMGQSQPKWRYYFRVPSIARAKDAVAQAGGKVTNGPHEVPGGDYVVIGIDPQGAEFALVGGA
ncbi:MAG TPA: VOC family protein [Sphingomicrobium sp.]|nr:VOC family protein [Sphingomicrobium sp.]